MATDVAKVVCVSPAGVVESQDKPGTSHSQVRCADLLVAGFVFVGKAMRVARRIAGRQTTTQPRSAVDAIALMDGVNGNYFGGVRKGQGRGSGRPGMSCAVDRALGVGAQSSARRNCFVVPVPWYTHRAQVKNLSNMTLVMCTID